MKRRIALITAIFMLLFSLPVFGADFLDMPAEDSKYFKAFEYAVAKKLIAGDGNSLKPDSLITYAEALTIISRIKPFEASETDITAFGVTKDKWYYSTVAKAYTLGYIKADSNGKLIPEAFVTKIDAYNMIAKIYGKTTSPVTENTSCSRADFVSEIYLQAPDGYSLAINQTGTSTTPSEGTTEYSDIKAKAALEAMQVALGILSDGTVYTKVDSYKDQSNTDWASGKVSGGSTSRPSTPTEPKEEEPNEDPSETTPTEPPTEDPTDEPTGKPTEPKEEEPTEPETAEPTYGEYDGPIDNDKDNVIDDPFNDGWTPPGMGGGDDSGDDNGNGSGNGGWDAEDEDFNINDADEPDYEPETMPTNPTENPSENESETPSEGESDAPSENESETPSEGESDTPSENESEPPSEGESDAPSENESETPSEGESDAPSENESETPSEGESDAPSENESGTPSEDATLPPDPEDDKAESGDGEEGSDEDNLSGDEGTAVLLSKERWFD